MESGVSFSSETRQAVHISEVSWNVGFLSVLKRGRQSVFQSIVLCGISFSSETRQAVRTSGVSCNVTGIGIYFCSEKSQAVRISGFSWNLTGIYYLL